MPHDFFTNSQSSRVMTRSSSAWTAASGNLFPSTMRWTFSGEPQLSAKPRTSRRLTRVPSSGAKKSVVYSFRFGRMWSRIAWPKGSRCFFDSSSRSFVTSLTTFMTFRRHGPCGSPPSR